MQASSSDAVNFDGVDVCNLHGVAFRDDIAVATAPAQKPADDEIEQSCRIANIHETIATLLQGYDIEGYPKGRRFSASGNAARADVIFVVAAGTATTKGRHEEVIETSESYRLNATQQMLGHRRHSG
ncbi:ABC multidrug transporter [Colletotrichum musicola]|uniref:ABC multidrug transporter n=1 Tax=Colletotrichum musicola TaxID=2175873 RepID=A0A8H6KXK1_9PEZI|nr:ABC multidrug transporter [Colletotrichum musicola]